MKPTRPLSIHHFIAPARLGGMESVVVELCAGLMARDHRVRVTPVLAEDAPADHPFVAKLRSAGVPVLPLRVGDRAYRTEWVRARARLTEDRPDIVHTHGFRPDLLEGWLARKLGLPVVSTVHGFTGAGWRTRLYRWLQRRALRRFDGVIAVSAPLAHELREAGVPEGCIHRIPNARPASTPLRDAADARRALGVSPDAFHVGWIGRLSAEKGPDVFVRALAELPRNLVVASVVGDGPLRPGLPGLADALDLDGSVRWHGEVPDARTLMRAFDVVVLSSRTEGTPVVLMEAVDAGVPVIATRVGGVPDVVSEREASLVAPERPDLLADAIRDALHHPDHARLRASRALARMESEGDRKLWIDRHEDAYMGALARHQRNGDHA